MKTRTWVLGLVLACLIGLFQAYAGGGGGFQYPMPETEVPPPGHDDCQAPTMTITDVQQIDPSKTGMKIVNNSGTAKTEILLIEVVTASGTHYLNVEAPVAANSTRNVQVSFLTLYSSASYRLCATRTGGITDDPVPIVAASSDTPIIVY